MAGNSKYFTAELRYFSVSIISGLRDTKAVILLAELKLHFPHIFSTTFHDAREELCFLENASACACLVSSSARVSSNKEVQRERPYMQNCLFPLVFIVISNDTELKLKNLAANFRNET